ncbi:MAG: dihydrodipicolinate reductase C-terminal domain-containing protein [Acidobacteriaceae bacterium]|nr:dihydrodipicolinate reductase C-terminal domain-containing protein [Acidobacteriaceae bacterium]
MRILVLGQGKTGKLVAEVARERGHVVRGMDVQDNAGATALTPTFLADFDVAIDFTTPEAVVENMRAILTAGSKIVVGTTGWYARLPEMLALAESNKAGLLYGTNYSIGVQVVMKLAQQMGAALAGVGYKFSMVETHHTAKLDKPSGTAISIAEMVERGADAKLDLPIDSIREGDAKGTHTLEAVSEADRIVLTHEAFSRRGFAEGAVRAAEWLATRTGSYDFRDVWEKL